MERKFVGRICGFSRRRWMAWVLILLLLCGLFPGCTSPQGETGKPASPSGRGRYIETELPLPEAMQFPLLLTLDAAGEPEILAAEEQTLAWYRRENGTFTRTEPAWAAGLPENYQPTGAAKGADGKLWLLFSEYTPLGEGETQQTDTGIIPHLYEADEAGGKLREIPLEPDGSGEICQMVEGLRLLRDGSLLIDSFPAGLLRYSASGALMQSYPINHSGFAALGDSLFIAPYYGETLTELGLADGEEKGRRPCPQESSTLLWAQEGALYALNSAGLFRVEEREYETLLEGGRFQMSSQNFAPNLAVKTEEGFAILYTDLRDYTPALYLYTFDPQAESATRTLRVQSLYDFELVREAASEMQRRDPSLTVEVQALLGDEGSGMTVSDALKSINTALLAGQGADVYILDGMPLKSLSEKGVLLELGDFVREHTASGEWLPNIALSLSKEQGLYALPVKFGIPILWGDAKLLAAGSSLSSLADFAAQHPKEPLCYAMHPKNLIQRFFPACSLSFQDADGVLQQEAFAGFLEDIGKLAATAPGAQYQEMGSGMDGSMEVPAYHERLCRAIIQEVVSDRLLSIDMSASADRGEDGDFIPLPGMSQGVFIPHIVAGINAKSTQVQDAKALIALMLDEEIQSIDFSDYEGLPTNAKALERLISSPEEQTPMTVGYGLGDDNLVLVQVDTHPTPEMCARFLALCRAAQTPCLQDPVLLEMVEDETAAFFEGGQTAAEAAAAVAARTQAYLNE